MHARTHAHTHTHTHTHTHCVVILLLLSLSSGMRLAMVTVIFSFHSSTFSITCLQPLWVSFYLFLLFSIFLPLFSDVCQRRAGVAFLVFLASLHFLGISSLCQFFISHSVHVSGPFQPIPHQFLLLLFSYQILDGALCKAFKVQRELVSPLQVTHLPPCVGSFASPGIDTRQKRPPAFRVYYERHCKCGVNEIV